MAQQRQFIFGMMLGLTIAFIIAGLRMFSMTDVIPSISSVRMDEHQAWDKVLAERVPVRMLTFNDEHLHTDDVTEAKRLFNKVRVLVWVMTSPQNLQTKARIVRDTWGRRCNMLLFFSSETNKTFPTIGLNVSEGRDHLTAKTMNGFKYIYDHHMNDADWFMKVDDDTYVIMENLRYFLSNENTSEPIFFGHHFKTIVKQGYYSGGGGYVVSKESLRRFGEKGIHIGYLPFTRASFHEPTASNIPFTKCFVTRANDLGFAGSLPNVCTPDGGAEDAEFGHCMEKLGVKTRDSKDVLGRSRFHCFDPEMHLFGGYPDWYYQYDANGAKKGPDSISDYAITFHYISPEKMQALDFFIYHLNPYGVVNGRQDLNKLRTKQTPSEQNQTKG